MLFWRPRLHLCETRLELPKVTKILTYKNLSCEIND